MVRYVHVFFTWGWKNLCYNRFQCYSEHFSYSIFCLGIFPSPSPSSKVSLARNCPTPLTLVTLLRLGRGEIVRASSCPAVLCCGYLKSQMKHRHVGVMVCLSEQWK